MPEHPPPRRVERYADVAVIGGSAAGLAAALQLARQRRSVIVIDDGSPRNAPAAHMHGYLGRDGVAPSDLVEIGREEIRGYGGEVLLGRALAVRAGADGRFHVELAGGHDLVARRVVAATGIIDELPDIEGLAERWGHEVIHCPFCHGFEVRDQRLVQIVTHSMGLHPVAVLQHLTDRLTVVLHDDSDLDESVVDALTGGGVSFVRDRVRRIDSSGDDGVLEVELDSGPPLTADAVLVGPRFRARAEVFAPAGLTTSPHVSGLGDLIETDQAGQTIVPGLYAAGNLTDPTLQVLSAAAHGSRVGAMVAFSLADDDLRLAERSSGEEEDWDHRYGDGDRMWSGNPNGTLVAEVQDLAPGAALDVGAGEGADALWLAEQGWQVTASDISGNALARVLSEAGRRGLTVQCLRADANDLDPFGSETYDLVSLQYGSFHRTPDQRGLHHLLRAVAPGGTLLVVSHDLTPLHEPVDPATQTRMFDPDAFVGIDEIATVLVDTEGWLIEVHETRSRPPGAASTHHVDDVVLRARRHLLPDPVVSA